MLGERSHQDRDIVHNLRLALDLDRLGVNATAQSCVKIRKYPANLVLSPTFTGRCLEILLDCSCSLH